MYYCVNVYSCLDFGFVMQVQQLEDIFMHRWGKYCSGIVEFADATKTSRRNSDMLCVKMTQVNMNR